MMRCSLCTRPLDQPDQPLSRDFGGDCLDCAIASEDAGPVPDGLSPVQLLLWLDIRFDVEKHLLDGAPAYHYDPIRRTAPDRLPIKVAMIATWRARLAEHGYSEEDARLLIHSIVDRTWCVSKDRLCHV